MMIKGLLIIAIILGCSIGGIYFLVVNMEKRDVQQAVERKSVFQLGHEYVVRRSSYGTDPKVEADNKEALANGYEIFDTSAAGGNGWESFTVTYKKKKQCPNPERQAPNDTP